MNRRQRQRHRIHQARRLSEERLQRKAHHRRRRHPACGSGLIGGRVRCCLLLRESLPASNRTSYSAAMTAFVDLPDQKHIVLSGVSWSYYEQTLKAIGDQRIHVAFLDGIIELMSPLPEHERPKKAIANLIVVLAMERRVPMNSFGSTTFRREEKSAGSEPDECFYFNDLVTIKGMERFDPLLHRPPDLWVEVDIFSPSVPREPICASWGPRIALAAGMVSPFGCLRRPASTPTRPRAWLSPFFRWPRLHISLKKCQVAMRLQRCLSSAIG